MSVSTDSTLRDPLDTTAMQSNGWTCKMCSLEQSNESTYCQMCLFARPLDRRGVPQIFSGFKIHFNGVIARNLVHPSHAVEWRMAERHGAVCECTFDPAVINLLIYRPGYERSEKCRSCIEKHTTIPVVPITWMLDSLLQSRQILLSTYQLKSIPAVALPTTHGSNLPHHQHPFYQLNYKDYSIPTSFPVEKPKKNKKGAEAGRNGGDAALNQELPPFFEVAERQHIVVEITRVALLCLPENYVHDENSRVNDKLLKIKNSKKYKKSNNNDGGNNDDVDDVDDDNSGAQEDERETKNPQRKTAGLELLKCQLSQNKLDRMLFAGLTVILSPTLQTQNFKEVLVQYGAKVIEVDNTVESICNSKPTHIIYAREDKKCSLMLLAAYIVTCRDSTIKLVQSNWIEDCLLLGEVIPAVGMYAPTAKLMETLINKYNWQSRQSTAEEVRA